MSSGSSSSGDSGGGGAGGNSWTDIESDPGVFTELIERIGARGFQVEEIYGMDDDDGGDAVFAPLRPVYGLVFLFKWEAQIAHASAPLSAIADADTDAAPQDVPGVFFARQVINNACATQAILSILLNIPDGAGGAVDIGTELRSFRDFTRDFPPELRGLAISNSDAIRAAHNSFARVESFVSEDEKKKRKVEKDGDVYHFISYVPVLGCVYELDGLQAGPVALGPVPQDGSGDWTSVARPAIRRRIERYAGGEIRFSLMAVVRNRGMVLAEALDAAKARGDTEASARIVQEIAAEQDKVAAWRAENIRRRHNYIPFIANLFRVLAEGGHLEPLLKKATERSKEALERKKQKTASQAAAPSQAPKSTQQ
jgi:ubiquitin carboxyl-terminal hydrolase L5